MAKSNEIDMLHGPLFMKILLFTLPLAASSVLQQLFNSIDVAVVGHFASSQALAAVGSNAPVISLIINLFLGVSMGANVVISNHIGQNDDKKIKQAVATAGMVAVVGGLLLMFIGVAVAKPILTLMGTPPDVLPLAILYLRIYFLGVAGVAIATGIANMVSAMLIIRLLMMEKEPIRLHINNIKVKWAELKPMLMIGVPAGLQGMVFSFSNVLVQSAINSHGAEAIAGSAAAQNFEYYCYYVIAAFDGAAITFIGQNYGAGLKHRVMRIYWICMAMSIVGSGVLNELFAWQSDFFLGFFSNDQGVKAFGTIRMETVLAFQFIACSYEISASALRGMGKSMLPTVLTIFGTCLLRIVWVYVVCPIWHSFDTIMLVYPITWCTTGILVCTAFYLTAKRLILLKNT